MKILQNPVFQKWMGRIVVVLLILLMALKWVFGWCSLWLCAVFVITVVGWAILSDLGTGMKDQ